MISQTGVGTQCQGLDGPGRAVGFCAGQDLSGKRKTAGAPTQAPASCLIPLSLSERVWHLGRTLLRTTFPQPASQLANGKRSHHSEGACNTAPAPAQLPHPGLLAPSLGRLRIPRCHPCSPTMAPPPPHSRTGGWLLSVATSGHVSLAHLPLALIASPCS